MRDGMCPFGPSKALLSRNDRGVGLAMYPDERLLLPGMSDPLPGTVKREGGGGWRPVGVGDRQDEVSS